MSLDGKFNENLKYFADVMESWMKKYFNGPDTAAGRELTWFLCIRGISLFCELHWSQSFTSQDESLNVLNSTHTHTTFVKLHKFSKVYRSTVNKILWINNCDRHRLARKIFRDFSGVRFELSLQLPYARAPLKCACRRRKSIKGKKIK